MFKNICRLGREKKKDRDLIPVLERQRKANLYELEASLVNRVSSRTAKDTQRNLVSKNPKIIVGPLCML